MRVVLAAWAAFATVFGVLAMQLNAGHDPALSAAQRAPALVAQAPARSSAPAARPATPAPAASHAPVTTRSS
jgi:hypothetical protein